MTPRIALPALLLLLAAGPASAQSVDQPRKAEYATRWDPAQGGPRTAAEVVQVLGLSAPAEARYEVQYYDAPPPATAPEGAVTIVRERTKVGGETQILLKYRRSQPLTTPWVCALGEDAKRAEEVDVSFGAGGRITRVYAYSCAVTANEPPPSLNATPKACAVMMTRTAAQGLKIESWELPGGKALLEVSRSADNTEEELARFQEIYQRLARAGVTPTASSKTELSSSCD